MKASYRWVLLSVVCLSVTDRLEAQNGGEAAAPVEETACMMCHGAAEVMVGDMARYLVTEKHLSDDIHWQKGIHCHDCHGGDETELDFRAAHAEEAGFRSVKAITSIPGFCGHCHSNAEYMSGFHPSPKTDQEASYLTSGHGKRLQESGDEKVATCVSCHGNHGIRAINDPQSPVFPTRVAETCAKCHADAEAMAGRQYHGRPIGHDQLELWKKSKHANLLLDKGDLSAPTCNDCHGNHGAVAPQVGSVSSACGTCHVQVAQLFAETRMKHRFSETELPGCGTCHGYHEVRSPSDEMLGMGQGAVCAPCHENGQFGATLAGANAARQMRSSLEELKKQIAKASTDLDKAERLGMEIRAPRFQLRDANDALANARSLVHGFAIEPMKEVVDEGLAVTKEVKQKAEHALQEHTNRRIWLALSMIPIMLVVGLLLFYIRQMPEPDEPEPD